MFLRWVFEDIHAGTMSYMFQIYTSNNSAIYTTIHLTSAVALSFDLNADSDVTRSLQLEEEKYECNSRERSDSDLARQLQAEWNATDVDTDTEVHVRTGTDTSELNKETSPTKKMTRHRTDR